MLRFNLLKGWDVWRLFPSKIFHLLSIWEQTSQPINNHPSLRLMGQTLKHPKKPRQSKANKHSHIGNQHILKAKMSNSSNIDKCGKKWLKCGISNKKWGKMSFIIIKPHYIIWCVGKARSHILHPQASCLTFYQGLPITSFLKNILSKTSNSTSKHTFFGLT